MQKCPMRRHMFGLITERSNAEQIKHIAWLLTFFFKGHNCTDNSNFRAAQKSLRLNFIRSFPEFLFFVNFAILGIFFCFESIQRDRKMPLVSIILLNKKYRLHFKLIFFISRIISVEKMSLKVVLVRYCNHNTTSCF